jgi:glutathione S-transferase
MGKVPAATLGEVPITEHVAIFLYLADHFPDAKLAPTVGDPVRGPYLRWIVHCAACFEPAAADEPLKRDPRG